MTSAQIASNSEASTLVRDVKQLKVAVLERRSSSLQGLITFPPRWAGEIASDAAKRRAEKLFSPTPLRRR